MPKLRIKVIKNPESYDHDTLILLIGKTKGFGYVGRLPLGRLSYRVGLVHCPECDRENYSMCVGTGICSYCPFNLNKEYQKYADGRKTPTTPRTKDRKKGSAKVPYKKVKIYKESLVSEQASVW